MKSNIFMFSMLFFIFILIWFIVDLSDTNYWQEKELEHQTFIIYKQKDQIEKLIYLNKENQKAIKDVIKSMQNFIDKIGD